MKGIEGGLGMFLSTLNITKTFYFRENLKFFWILIFKAYFWLVLLRSNWLNSHCFWIKCGNHWTTVISRRLDEQENWEEIITLLKNNYSSILFLTFQYWTHKVLQKFWRFEILWKLNKILKNLWSVNPKIYVDKRIK